MRHLLSVHGRELLAQLASARCLLAFDFDGTLAPIVSRPEAAAMSVITTALLTRVCELFPTAVISGRGLADVRSRLTGVGVRYVVGDHGAEPNITPTPLSPLMRVARRELAALSERSQGLDLEVKPQSLAVHYRRARRKSEARENIAAVIAALPPGVRMIPGKFVVNVVSARAANKGDAVLALRARARADVVFYVGDDVTDEDVFSLDEPGRLISARVGRSKTTAAAYFLYRQNEIDRLLRHFVGLRA